MALSMSAIYTIPEATHHADPCPALSLSSSIAKMLCLEPGARAPRASTAQPGRRRRPMNGSTSAPRRTACCSKA
jgi:hypothetical protein